MATQAQAQDLGGSQLSTPPIAQLFPILSFALSALLSTAHALSRFVLATVGISLTPVSSLILPLLSFILAPFLVSLSLIAQLLLAPYYATVYIAQVVYPIYVIVGAAVICGAALGLCARQAVSSIGMLLFSGSSSRGRIPARPVARSNSSRSISKGKGKRKASVKFERYES